ncbi:MAG: TspO/MBR family protein [Polyangiaceae bacterium]
MSSETSSQGFDRWRVLRLLGAVVACNAVGVVGAAFTSTDTAWYLGLDKPFFQPPGWIFGPVWTTLYTLMGVAAFRVFERSHRPGARLALVVFAAQLAVNAIWSPVFFGAEAVVAALVILLLLVALVTATIATFWRVDRTAGLLLLPYLAWGLFATALNASIAALN